jgi:hypothetical protein
VLVLVAVDAALEALLEAEAALLLTLELNELTSELMLDATLDNEEETAGPVPVMEVKAADPAEVSEDSTEDAPDVIDAKSEDAAEAIEEMTEPGALVTVAMMEETSDSMEETTPCACVMLE